MSWDNYVYNLPSLSLPKPPVSQSCCKSHGKYPKLRKTALLWIRLICTHVYYLPFFPHPKPPVPDAPVRHIVILRKIMHGVVSRKTLVMCSKWLITKWVFCKQDHVNSLFIISPHFPYSKQAFCKQDHEVILIIISPLFPHPKPPVPHSSRKTHGEISYNHWMNAKRHR